MNATRGPQEGIEVRWGLHEDEARIAELLVLNGISSRVAARERFIVAERDGRAVAALRYETEPKSSCWAPSSWTPGPARLAGSTQAGFAGRPRTTIPRLSTRSLSWTTTRAPSCGCAPTP